MFLQTNVAGWWFHIALSSVSPAESDGEPGHVVVDPDEADEGLEVEAEHGRQLFLGVEQDGHGDADGDDVE